MVCVCLGGGGGGGLLRAGVSTVCVPKRSLVCVIMLMLCFASWFSFCCSKCWRASSFADTPVFSPRPEAADVHGRCPGDCLRDEFMQLFGNERKRRVCLSSGAGLCWFVQTQMWRPCLARGKRLEEGLPGRELDGLHWRLQH